MTESTDALAPVQDKPKLKFFSYRLGWAVGAAGPNLMNTLQSSVVLFYLTNVISIDVGVAGVLLFISKLYDMAINPIVGVASDRTRSRLGRRRPYLAVGGILAALAVLLMFNIPASLSETLRIVVVLAVMLLYSTSYTLFIVPFLAMPGEMTLGYDERSKLMAMRNVFASTGLFMAMVVAPALIALPGEQTNAFRILGVVMSIFVGVTMLTAFFATAGAPLVETGERKRATLKESLSALWSNRPFLALLGAKFFGVVGTVVSSGGSLFFITQVMQQSPRWASAYGLAVIGANVLSMPFWLWVSKRLTKKITLIIATLGVGLMNMSWLLASPAEGIEFFVLRGLLSGVAAGGVLVTLFAMLPDTMEYDRERFGLRREGLFAGVFALSEKLAYTTVALLIASILASAGFVKGLPPGQLQSPQVIDTLYFIKGVLAPAANLLSVVCVLMYFLKPTSREAPQS